MQPPVAEPTTDGGQFPDALAEPGIVGATASVADRRAIQTKCGAGPPLAHIMRVAHVSDSLPSSGGRHHFREFTSFRIALSSIVSASSFFSFAFSSSSERSRLASETSMPQNFGEQAIEGGPAEAVLAADVRCRTPGFLLPLDAIQLGMTSC